MDRGDWRVLVIGGASGTGKTDLSRRLARRLGLSVLEADDLVTAVQAVSTPEQLPLLHFWDSHPEAHGWPADRIADLTIRVAEALQPAFDAVVRDHLDGGTPILIEGDYFVAGAGGGAAGRARRRPARTRRGSADPQLRQPRAG